MQIIYSDKKDFTQRQVESLFLSVHWVSGQYPKQPRLLTRCKRATACGSLQKSALVTAPGTMRSRN